jgi:hypothetical protein
MMITRLKQNTNEIRNNIDKIISLQNLIDTTKDNNEKERLKGEMIKKRLDIDLLLNKI